MKRIAFRTVGCRLNQAETAQIAGQFHEGGWEIARFDEACDVYVVHTCTVTAKAEKDSIRIARSAKRENPPATVIMIGCAGETGADKLKLESGADIVIGQKGKYDLPGLLHQLFPGNEARPAGAAIPVFQTKRATVKAQDGCDFRCSYCIVPDARGKPWSRPAGEIVDEVKRLADKGFKEIVLTGANLGCYRDGTKSLIDLAKELEAVHGVSRIRLSSIEISTVERELIDYMAGSSKLCRFLHVPLQSGDDRVLAAMRRRYTAAQFRNFCDYAISKIPLLGLGTDIIVGFPGEDGPAFENTKNLVNKQPFSNLHVFSYSKRDGTPAARIPWYVPERDKKHRSAELIALGDRKLAAFAGKFIGKTVEVLVEKVESDGSATGWTSEYVAARMTGITCAPNDIVRVQIRATDSDTVLN